jgi:site-specific DNA-cytosine methylase
MECLDLFTGISGIALGLLGLIEPIAYCDINKRCIAVLLKRMKDDT